jgi:hypothetical protein
MNPRPLSVCLARKAHIRQTQEKRIVTNALLGSLTTTTKLTRQREDKGASFAQKESTKLGLDAQVA